MISLPAMRLISLTNCVPEACFTQRECWEIFTRSRAYDRMRAPARGLAEKVLLGDNGIETRHFALREIDRLFDLDAESLNFAFEREGPALGQRALREALSKAGVEPREIDGLFVCTCTGYLCPGLSSFVAEALGLRADAVLDDLVGLGCGAAVPTLRRASDFLTAHPGAVAAVLAVEICSAAFYLDETPGVIISACLFGDGASASLWTSGNGRDGVQAGEFASLHLPQWRDYLRFENRGGKLRNLLHPTVPEKAAEAVARLHEASGGGSAGAIVSHSGGREVLRAIEGRLGRPTEPGSRKVLNRYGNMSSPSVLFALEDYLGNGGVHPDGAWLVTFGAGFSAHCCRISVTPKNHRGN